jgi:hypothetical protein
MHFIILSSLKKTVASYRFPESMSSLCFGQFVPRGMNRQKGYQKMIYADLTGLHPVRSPIIKDFITDSRYRCNVPI